ncbi:hypothetical protein HU200_063742 [Digitaria exilis]|uniref:Histone chaperone domain-containing protein n=1 Tax=Digitaria exilis TaxID=1010633 RepID=A0A835DW53_9POAL|nr:hypothetical protein HU200_063742 [Digitaria exilis]
MGDDAAAAAAREREAEIEKAMRARVPDFKKQADSLTLEGVRRALEKDLGLEIYSLDAHKKFIKQCVDKVYSACLVYHFVLQSNCGGRLLPIYAFGTPLRTEHYAYWDNSQPTLFFVGQILEQVFAESDDENINDNASEDAEAKDDHLSKEGPDDAKPMLNLNKTSSSADDQVVKSSETGKDPDEEKDKTSNSVICEDMIKEAIEKRAFYFRKNSETLTLQGVRRTLEEDLKLQKKSLDAYKNFITTELDKVLQEPANGTKKKSKKESPMDTDQKTSKGSKRGREDSENSGLNDSQSEMEDSDEDTRPTKKKAEKAKVIKKQKKVAVQKKQSTPKSKKVAKRDSDRSADEQGGNSAEEDNSHSSAEEDNKIKRQQTPTYGRQVEHLKSIIKSCGMTYYLTLDLLYEFMDFGMRNFANISWWFCKVFKMNYVGLFSPSLTFFLMLYAEIKAVKKRKERAKELEGIDMSNIITSSRRRSSSSFIPLPPPPKIEADSDDGDDDAEDDDEDEENVEGGDEGDNDDAKAGDDSADGMIAFFK